MLAQRPTRIVGGKDAQKGIHPWQVSVQWGDPTRKIPTKHICGGSLITAGWILTAGHCKTLSPRTGEFRILAGKYKLKMIEETEQERLVNRVFVHPRYKGWDLFIYLFFYYPHVITILRNSAQSRRVGPYDIALMQVERPFELNLFVSTVSLPYPDTIPVGDAMLTGWGSIGRSHAHESPENLQAAILPIINYQLCNKMITKSLKPKEKNPLHPTNVCTGPLDGSLAACKV